MEETEANAAEDQPETQWSKLVIQRYEGETCHGQPNGEGVACFEGGHVYKGTFSKGLMDGQGAFTWTGGLKYEGSFVCNIIMGQGTYLWPDGSTYRGQVHHGVRHGHGTYHCAKSGVVYRGQWHQGKKQGKGAVCFNQDGSSWYEGDWASNRIEGSGVRRYLSGNVYCGEWLNNLRHGEGMMKWLLQGQQYEGTWNKGVQHGRGKHTWILKREDVSRFPQNNQYVGDFVYGQRHGQGTFFYADGAVYEGEWRNNKKHGQGTVTFKNGKIFQGEFVDDQIVEMKNDGPLPFLALDSSSILGPDMTLDIDDLLNNNFPEQRRASELKEVEFAVWKHSSDLRSIYNFYSRLGVSHSPENSFMMSQMQMWRLLKDCKVHHHDFTLWQIDSLTEGDTSVDIHSPFNRMMFRKLLSSLVIIAYHIYHKSMTSQRNLLAACFYKLMTNNILPNAKTVKGFLFKRQGLTEAALGHCRRSWEVFQTHSSLKAMTCGDLLFMFKDLNLFDNRLTVTKFMEVFTKESADPSNTRSSLNLEMTFLEFFETLLGCVEVKYQLDGDDTEKAAVTPVNSPVSSESEVDVAQTHTQDTSVAPIEVIFNSLAETDDRCRGQSKPEQSQNHFKVWEQTVCHFFDQVFFSAFEQHQQNLLKASS